MSYFASGKAHDCFGCEACAQVCPVRAITMKADAEGFRYPVIDETLCIHCGLCEKTCPHEHVSLFNQEAQYAFGGYHKETVIRQESTSGGAFSAIVDAFCDKNYVIFGAEAEGLHVFHRYTEDKQDLSRFRKSKYSQSNMGNCYAEAASFLKKGKKVLFSGTPCQIAGLLKLLNSKGIKDRSQLLTVEVVCEGVPSPLYMEKLDEDVALHYHHAIDAVDYRYTGKSVLGNGKWDFEQMKITAGNRVMKKDRWFNPFWVVWLKHYMSRPSCYRCPFAQQERVADLTLGDLWGVHLYCPELYGKNGGASLAVANTEKGKEVLRQAEQSMHGHELPMEEVLKYQSPMRRHIDDSPMREAFMSDLKSDMTYREINRKWAPPPSLKLLWSKYVWGNRQKIFVWNWKRRMKGENHHA